jgi:hypothetical protein
MYTWEVLLQKEIQEFIQKNENSDLHQLALQQKEFFKIPYHILAVQIASRKKAKSKIPLYYNTSNIVFPATLNLEQSSSEATARFKADFLKNNLPFSFTLADLSGGLGIDSYFLSNVAKTIVHVEPNTELQNMAAHNHRQLGVTSIQYVNDYAENFIKDRLNTFDTIYVDPSRRKENQKVFALQDCVPNVVELLPSIFDSASYILLKASPLLDITQALRQLVHIQKVIVLSVSNECKELLFFAKKGFEGESSVDAINLTENGSIQSTFSFLFSQEQVSNPTFSKPLTYLYEPSASVLKAGAFKCIASSFNLYKIAAHTHLYTSEDKVEAFPGRIFSVEKLLKADEKTVSAHLPENKANIITRNYPLSPEALKKKLKIMDGGTQYLLAFSGIKNKYLALCSRLR